MHGPTSVGVILVISTLLGLRHASDPDHLAAVTTLIASEEDLDKVRKAGFMGLLWGLGHGTTLVLIGLPLVLFNRYLPEVVQQAARSEEHTSELQSRQYLVCRLLLEKKIT